MTPWPAESPPIRPCCRSKKATALAENRSASGTSGAVGDGDPPGNGLGFSGTAGADAVGDAVTEATMEEVGECDAASDGTTVGPPTRRGAIATRATTSTAKVHF